MFRLLSFFVTILGFAAVVWFGVTVELGDRTLFGHLRAIGGSNEAKQLWDGTKDKVTGLVGEDTLKGAEILKETFGAGDKADKPGKPDQLGKPDKNDKVDTGKGVAVDRAKAPAQAGSKPAREAAPTKLARASAKPPEKRPDPAAK